MKVVNSECVGCPKEMGCIYNSCPYYAVVRYYCDECGEEEELYEFDGQKLCASCVLKKLEKVEGSFYY